MRRNPCGNSRRAGPPGWAMLALLVAACREPTTASPVLWGTVYAPGGRAVAGATVQVGSDVRVTDQAGRFQFDRVTPGRIVLRASAQGYQSDSFAVDVRGGSTRALVQLPHLNVFEFGSYALYYPRQRNISSWGPRTSVDTAFAVVVALGGPDTRAFVTGKPFGAPNPAVEAALQEMGDSLRALANTMSIAILGTSSAALPNSAASDASILAALDAAADASGRVELRRAPIMAYGLSGGGPEASGLMARRKSRVIGGLLKVPVALEPYVPSDTTIPAFVMLAEQDAFVNTAAIATDVVARRAAGAAWGMALEKGVIHHSLSAPQRALTLQWMRDVMHLSFYCDGWDTAGWPIGPQRIDERSGYVGDPVTGTVSGWGPALSARWYSYSWLPKAASAARWKAIILPGSTGTVASEPDGCDVWGT